MAIHGREVHQVTTTLEAATLSALYKKIRSSPSDLQHDPVSVCMAVNAERRIGENNTIKLLLDSASTINISTTRAGMHGMKKCNKAVESANKETTYAMEVGTRKFRGAEPRANENNRNPIVCLSETHLMEGFLNDIVSLPVLLKKGCRVHVCDQDRILIALPTNGDGYPQGYTMACARIQES